MQKKSNGFENGQNALIRQVIESVEDATSEDATSKEVATSDINTVPSTSNPSTPNPSIPNLNLRDQRLFHHLKSDHFKNYGQDVRSQVEARKADTPLSQSLKPLLDSVNQDQQNRPHPEERPHPQKVTHPEDRSHPQEVTHPVPHQKSLPHSLSATHQEKLAGCLPAVITERGYRSVQDSPTLENAGFPPSMNPALLIPWHNVHGEIAGFQIRPDSPPQIKGKSQKYLFPKGRKNFLDVPPRCRQHLGNLKKPLYIVEGPIKADYLASQGACAVGIAGVTGWRGSNETGGKTALGCWQEIALNNRAVYLTFDSDLKDKPTVLKQAIVLKTYLQTRGSRVYIVDIPHGPNQEKQGPDDFLRNGGTLEELQSLVLTKHISTREIPKAPTAPDPLTIAAQRGETRPEDGDDSNQPHTTSTTRLTTTLTIIPGYPLTDTGNAERFLAQHGDRVLYSHVLGWHLWKQGRWCQDENKEVFKLGKATVRSIYQESAQAPADKKASIADWGKASESLARRNALIELAAKDGRKAEANDFDQHPWLLNVQNGTIDLEINQRGVPQFYEHRFYGHQSSNLITKMAPVVYDPQAKCPQFLKTLAAILGAHDNPGEAEEITQFLQRFLGYTLTGSTREQCFLILHGEGSNGKSTLLTLFRSLLGSYCKQTAPDTLMQRQSGEGISNDVAMLRGARMVTTTETSEGRRLDEAKIKAMTGGDAITARFLRKEFFEFVPEYKIYLATNHKPEIQGVYKGIWRRVRLVHFWDENKDAPGPQFLKADKQLDAILKSELSGVLNWALQGCMDWQRDGLPTPQAVLAATDQYRCEQDPLQDFLNEKCYCEAGCKLTNSEMFTAYERWAKEDGKGLLSNKAFSTRLKQKGFLQKRGTGGVRWWHGIGLLSADTASAPNDSPWSYPSDNEPFKATIAGGTTTK